MTRGTVTKALAELDFLRLTKIVFGVVDRAMKCILLRKIETDACLVVLRHLGRVAICFSLSIVVKRMETSCGFRSNVVNKDLRICRVWCLDSVTREGKEDTSCSDGDGTESRTISPEALIPENRARLRTLALITV